MVISLTEAKSEGLAWYFTGAPCKRGHIVRRRVSNRRCEECEKIGVSAWKAANPEKFKASADKYRDRYPERVKEQGRRREAKRRQKYPEQIRLANKVAFDKNRAEYYATQRLYAKSNPDIIRAANAAYRARKRTAVGTLTAAEFSAILERQKHRCHWCCDSIKTGSQIDHVIPLVRGGEHSAANVVGSCGPCNRRKRSKDPILWANEIGRLF
jgi:5-methylcytosine-specific restriction endonuclease McrA